MTRSMALGWRRRVEEAGLGGARGLPRRGEMAEGGGGGGGRRAARPGGGVKPPSSVKFVLVHIRMKGKKNRYSTWGGSTHAWSALITMRAWPSWP